MQVCLSMCVCGGGVRVISPFLIFSAHSKYIYFNAFVHVCVFLSVNNNK